MGGAEAAATADSTASHTLLLASVYRRSVYTDIYISLSTGFHQARDTTPSVPATDLHRDEVGHASPEEEEEVEDSAEERHRIRLVVLAVTTSSENRAPRDTRTENCIDSHGEIGSTETEN